MLSFKPYNELAVATQTWVIYTNLNIDNDVLFDAVVCPLLKHPLRSSVQKMKVREEETLEDGSIVFMKYKNKTKGIAFKASNGREMRNCSTLIVKVRDRYHNVKLSRGGSFQMTGIKHEDYAKEIIKHIWNLLCKTEGSWTFQNGFTDLLGYMTCRMYNVLFSFKPFGVDLDKLNYHIKMDIGQQRPEAGGEVEYSSTYEPSVGYVGSNIKISSKKELITEASVIRITARVGQPLEFSDAKFSEYLEKLHQSSKSKKLGTNYQNSFLVFSTGYVIMSGKISSVNREDSYRKFCELIASNKNKFLLLNEEEAKDEPSSVVDT